MSVSTNYKNNVTTIDFKSLVLAEEGPSYNEPEVVYEFSDGKKFKSTDATDSGIYDGS